MSVSKLIGALTRDPRQSQASNSPAMQAAQQAAQMTRRPMPSQRMPGPGPVPAMPRPNQPMPGPGAVPPMGRPNQPMPQPSWNDRVPNIPQGTNINDMVGRVHAYQTSNMPPQSMQDMAQAGADLAARYTQNPGMGVPQYSTQPMPNPMIPMPNYGPGQQPQMPQMNRMIMPTTTRGRNY